MNIDSALPVEMQEAMRQAQEMMQNLGIIRTEKPADISKVQELVNALFGVHSGTLPFGVGDEFQKLHLRAPEGSLRKGNREICKLTFWVNLEGYTADLTQDTVSPRARVSLTYKDGAKQLFVLPNMLPMTAGVSFVLDKVKALIEVGAEVELAYCHQNRRQVLDWNERYDHADPCEAIFYQLSRRNLASMFVPKIQEMQLDKPVELFSFGCGDGSDIKAVQDALADELHYIPKAYGMDRNASYFDTTLENVSLSEGDLGAIDRWLEGKATSNASKIGLFMGSLTNQVSVSSYAALKSLHAVENFDLVIVSGYTPVLLAKRIFKAAGWNVELRSTNSHWNNDPARRIILKPKQGVIRPDVRNVYILEPMRANERAAYLEERGTKRSARQVFDVLDLSCSHKPLEDLKLFDSLATHRQVDISWCAFNEAELAEFVAALEGRINDPIKLMASGDEPWFGAFCAIQSSKLSLIQRLDHKPNEIAPFVPATAKRIGVYKSMPFQQITKD